ncbi:MAG: hypothetical protein NC408_02875 [Candidatus Gastranaerophilales bacterium]|nr:hypothetical protein [Candidatus Gastranaerophilales bacterium]MCM1072953.1 hypothetical protein [Bacteroides sp.]
MGVGMNNNSNLFMKIQQQIETAEKAGQPISHLVKQQIELLKGSHDEFVKTAADKGYDKASFTFGKMEIDYFAAMRQLAQKIGLPLDEYDERIKQIQIRIMGEENYNRVFGNRN